jgi:PIN domain nuclease of toxin-antitoxin system
LPGVLLDTHALYWLVSGEERLSDEALAAIGESQEAGTLFVSPITAWELALASRKASDPTNFGDVSPEAWFRAAMRATLAKLVPIGQRIALEAATVPVLKGHKDPGDCYLIATARVRKIPIITRDARMKEFTADQYLDVIVC